ncbi:MAG: hypothetical protein ACI83P_002037 [Janthinobacterium sp.]|jgi:uncharacterized protein YcbK (DUF882 family)
MASRRNFLQHGLRLTALGVILSPIVGCAARATASASAPTSVVAAGTVLLPAQQFRIEPPPDIFDAQVLDSAFWLRPRMLEVTRPASQEHVKLLYWKDGEMVDAAYQELCHMLRDVNGKKTAAIDPKLLETLWGTQAFVARYGINSPLEILSGYRTQQSNAKLIEAGVPAARQSLHIQGRAADIRIANLNPEVLGGLVRSFRQGGVGFYYRPGARGGWIHADTGLNRTWKG